MKTFVSLALVVLASTLGTSPLVAATHASDPSTKAVPATTKATQTKKTGDDGNASKTPSVLEQRLAAIEAGLSKIQSNKAYKPLFESEDKTILIVQAWFSRAQKSIHDMSNAVSAGQGLDVSTADWFHSSLHEYLMNLTEMPAGMAFGATKAPDSNTKKSLIRDVMDMVEFANKTPGLEAASLLVLTPDSSASDAVSYAKRNLFDVYVLLNNRTLTYVTSPGTSASTDLRSALDAVSQSLDKLVDVGGNHVVQLGEDGKPLLDQLGEVRAAMNEARAQAEFFEKGYLPNAWRDAHRRRAELIVQRLSKKGFESKLSLVKALKVVDEHEAVARWR